MKLLFLSLSLLFSINLIAADQRLGPVMKNENNVLVVENVDDIILKKNVSDNPGISLFKEVANLKSEIQVLKSIVDKLNQELLFVKTQVNGPYSVYFKNEK